MIALQWTTFTASPLLSSLLLLSLLPSSCPLLSSFPSPSVLSFLSSCLAPLLSLLAEGLTLSFGLWLIRALSVYGLSVSVLVCLYHFPSSPFFQVSHMFCVTVDIRGSGCLSACLNVQKSHAVTVVCRKESKWLMFMFMHATVCTIKNLRGWIEREANDCMIFNKLY